MEYANATPAGVVTPPPQAVIPTPVTYCLYARKSTEQDEKQALSIDSQIKEMTRIAEQDGLHVAEIRKEAHSAKDAGQRLVYNQLIEDVRKGIFNGILTWAPDRLSRNAGDLGVLVDLMDQKVLVEIRTYGQKFTNSPNEKFLLMILGSQAKLENDNRSVNVKRGLRTRVEMGLWPCLAPTGYLNEKRTDKKCQVLVDPKRALIVKQIFEKIGNENYSGKKAYLWLREINFTARSGKSLSLSNLYLLLRNHFYYGLIEYPRNSSNWYTGKHEPLITKELFGKVQEQLTRSLIVNENKEFAFTKLMKCGLCGSGITADEKFKRPLNGKVHRYVYYICTKKNDSHCKNGYLREEDLIDQLLNLVDRVSLDKLGIREKINKEVDRYHKFRTGVLGREEKERIKNKDGEAKKYVKYILQNGAVLEKRELLSHLKSRLIVKNKTVLLED